MINPDTIPVELCALDQWVCWHYVTRQGTPTKVPLDPRRLCPARSNDPATWGTFRQAWRSYEWRDATGIGIMFAGGLLGVDLDGVVTPQGLLPWAAEIVAALPTYWEYSPSGRGVHAYAWGRLPGDRCRTAIEGHSVEFYEDGRFFTVTGQHFAGTPGTLTDVTNRLGEIYSRLFSDATAPVPPQTPTRANCGDRHPLTDADIIRIASKARNGGKFLRLWRGDTAGYTSASEADAALLAILGFYTQDAGQLDRLFRLSCLSDAKWTGRPDYRARTIAKALAGQRATFGERAA